MRTTVFMYCVAFALSVMVCSAKVTKPGIKRNGKLLHARYCELAQSRKQNIASVALTGQQPSIKEAFPPSLPDLQASIGIPVHYNNHELHARIEVRCRSDTF
ncbi:MAG TPA: hypothetical protein VL576_01775 [Candidatus Paceibacterota bacterium]|jgi:hypothetical protein|nr:hypothetical protein [Candidatus Paceibacterota bacterium]